MGDKPKHEELLTEDFFIEHYIKNNMSYPKIREMLLSQGYNIHVGTLYNYAKKYGIGRNISEASKKIENYSNNCQISFLCESIIESFDGFLLSGGKIEKDNKSTNNMAKLYRRFQDREFAEYVMKFLRIYESDIKEYKDKALLSGYRLDGQTKYHPDIYTQHNRWYIKENGKKIKRPPKDIRITSKTLLMWYLGNGSLVKIGNSIVIRLLTEDFSIDNINFLIEKIKNLGIDCKRNHDNRIYITSKGISNFFSIIGETSPVKCHENKFDLPLWRLDIKTMKEVSTMLNIDYNKLSYLVKIDKVPCFREKKNSKPRFNSEHIKYIKNNIENLCL